MKIFVDSTYLLPAFGIVIDPLPKTILEDIITCVKPPILISEIFFFEAAAKVAKSGLKDECDALPKKISIIKADPLIQVISLQEHPKIWSVACWLKRFHNDFVDTVHLSSAICMNVDYFITEDKKLLTLTNTRNFKDHLKKTFQLSSIKTIDVKTFLTRNKNILD